MGKSRLSSAEKELVGACASLSWRDHQDGMERLLSCLSWWLDEKDEHGAALLISGLAAEFRFNSESSSALEHLFDSTDCNSVNEILKRWGKLEQAEATLEAVLHGKE